MSVAGETARVSWYAEEMVGPGECLEGRWMWKDVGQTWWKRCVIDHVCRSSSSVVLPGNPRSPV